MSAKDQPQSLFFKPKTSEVVVDTIQINHFNFQRCFVYLFLFLRY